MNNIGLYIHIPFCKRKCLYCDFNSFEGKIDKVESYIDALIREIEMYKKKIQFSLKTIFIGGGTPTLINCFFIEKILNCIKSQFEDNIEISIECNPGTVDSKSLIVYKNSGINRLSIGLQAWQDDLLKRIGRIHDRAEFVKTLKAAREAGFNNINVDLMFALPGQTMEMWEETLNEVCKLGIEHISCYSLKLEEGTPLFDMHAKGIVRLPDEEADRDMYHRAIEILKSYGLEQYEISNFSKPGFSCAHNLIYWHNEEYLGVGAGSHSKLFGKRFNNVEDIEEYIKIINLNEFPIVYEELLDKKNNMWESIFLRLRLNEGLNISEFEKNFDVDFFKMYGEKLQYLKENGLIEWDHKVLKLTSKGRDLSNTVFIQFI